MEALTAKQLARLVLDTLKAQKAYFADRKRGLMAADKLEAAKVLERQLKQHAQAILGEEGPLLF